MDRFGEQNAMSSSWEGNLGFSLGSLNQFVLVSGIRATSTQSSRPVMLARGIGWGRMISLAWVAKMDPTLLGWSLVWSGEFDGKCRLITALAILLWIDGGKGSSVVDQLFGVDHWMGVLSSCLWIAGWGWCW